MSDIAEGEAMPIDRKKFEWNLNTILVIISIASSAGSAVWVTANKTRDIEELKSFQQDTKTVLASIQERVRTGEAQQQATDGRVDNLAYRANISEQNLAGITASIKEVSSSVNELTGDVKVVREILQRQDRQSSIGR